MAGGEPIGECEECRTWIAKGVLWWLITKFGNDEVHDCEVSSKDRLRELCVLEVEDKIDFVVDWIKARDMSKFGELEVDLLCWLISGSRGIQLTKGIQPFRWGPRVLWFCVGIRSPANFCVQWCFEMRLKTSPRLNKSQAPNEV